MKSETFKSEFFYLLELKKKKIIWINRQERFQSRNERTRKIKRHESTHKSSRVRQMKSHKNVTRMVITKAHAMTFGLGGKLKLLFIRNALISLFIYVLLYKVIESVICTFIQSYKS